MLNLTEPISAHHVTCDVTMLAKFIRISVAGGKYLFLHEVVTLGTKIEGEKSIKKAEKRRFYRTD